MPAPAARWRRGALAAGGRDGARAGGRGWVPAWPAGLAPTAGQAMVEVAVTLPLLLLVALGLVQFALVAHAHNVVTGAAQDGARVAAAVDRTTEDGEAHARTLLRAGLGSGTRVYVDGWEYPQVVVMTARAELRPIIPWTPTASIPVAAEAQMSKERFRVRE